MVFNTDELISLYNSGKSTLDISKIYGVNRKTIYNHLRGKIELKPKSKFTAEFNKKYVDLYLSGLPIIDIHKQTGLRIKSLYSLLKNSGVYKFRSNEDLSKRDYTSRRKYHFNQRYFENIDSELKAYFLGFIYADGCNTGSSLAMNLHKKDVHVLEKLKQEIGTDSPIYDTQKGLKGVTISSVSMVKDLTRHGCMQAKTFKLTFPDLPEHLVHHFIRGYFDGDGCICIGSRKWGRNFNIVGTLEFVSEVQKILVKNCNLSFTKIYAQKTKNGFVYYLKYTGRLQTNRIADYMYKDSSFHLMRKYDKFYKL